MAGIAICKENVTAQGAVRCRAYLSMIFSENRFPLFGIMLRTGTETSGQRVERGVAVPRKRVDFRARPGRHHP